MEQIRYFEGKRSADEWGRKYNFVDARNVVVGYDSEQSCCEYARWEWLDADRNVMEGFEPEVLDGWRFDSEFFEEGSHKRDDFYDECDEWVLFRAVHSDGSEMFLRLSNTHNGYYSHGFDMLVDGNVVKEGSI